LNNITWLSRFNSVHYLTRFISFTSPQASTFSPLG
jgi:hypothetical protein